MVLFRLDEGRRYGDNYLSALTMIRTHRWGQRGCRRSVFLDGIDGMGPVNNIFSSSGSVKFSFFFLKVGGRVCYLFLVLFFSLTVSPGQKLARYGFEIFVRENFKWGECENLISIRPQACSEPTRAPIQERGRRQRQRGGRKRGAHFRSGWRRGACAKATTMKISWNCRICHWKRPKVKHQLSPILP